MEVEEDRRVRQRTSEEDVGGEVLTFLRNRVPTDSHNFPDDGGHQLVRLDMNGFANEALVDDARFFCKQWTNRHVHIPWAGSKSTFEWAMGRDAPGKRFDMWHLITSDNVDDRIALTPRRLYAAMKREHYVLVSLVQALKDRDLCVNTRHEEDDGDCVWEQHLVRTAEVMVSAYELCTQELRVWCSSTDPDGTGLEVFTAVSDEDRFQQRHAIFHDPKDMTPICRLHDALLRYLKQNQLRKCDGELFREIYSHDGHRTFAWRPAEFGVGKLATFDAFYTENISRFLNYDLYEIGMMGDNRAKVIDQLQREDEPECPTLQRTRLFVSFRNCVMHVCGACFPYAARSTWDAIAAQRNAEIHDFARRSVERLAAVGVLAAPFSLAHCEMSDTGESMLIRPPTDDDAASHYIDEDVPEEYMNLPFAADDDEWTPADPWSSRLFAYMDDVYTPEFDSVQTTQDFERPTRFWDLVTLARSMLPGKTLESLHMYGMRQGRAGTGKSMQIQMLQHLMPPGKFAVLSNRAAEKTFWATGLQGVWVLAWLEAQSRGEPPIDKGTWQTMTANEMVNLPQKNRKAVMMRWLAALHVAGNEFPNWEDAQGSLRRRTLTFLYLNKVRQGDPEMEKRMRHRLGPLLIKMMHSYLLMLMLFPGMDWERELPLARGSAERRPIVGRQLREFQRRVSEELDPLQAFINVPDMFEFGRQFRMPEAAFVREYNAYRENMLGKGKVKWTEAHYMIVFESKEITRGSEEYTDPESGVTRPTPCLFGIALKDSE